MLEFAYGKKALWCASWGDLYVPPLAYSNSPFISKTPLLSIPWGNKRKEREKKGLFTCISHINNEKLLTLLSVKMCQKEAFDELSYLQDIKEVEFSNALENWEKTY